MKVTLKDILDELIENEKIEQKWLSQLFQRIMRKLKGSERDEQYPRVGE